MSSDLRALLAAVAANPADDVARLVYADCLEESGNAARAQFIRLQIEAERHHPDSNARAALEAQARVLFEEHWRAWWDEVCATVRLPPVDAWRYKLTQSGTTVAEAPSARPAGTQRWESENVHRLDVLTATFHRGFPESIGFTPIVSDRWDLKTVLSRWSGASPLAELLLYGWLPDPADWWPNGSFLRTVSALTFDQYEPAALNRLLKAPDLANVERLTLRPAHTASPTHTDVSGVLAAPCAPMLKHWTAPIRSAQSAESIASSKALSALESLEFSIGYERQQEILAPLVRGPALARLKHLTVSGPASAGTTHVICRAPVWSGLRSLHFVLGWGATSIGALASADGVSDLPELSECRITGLQFTPQSVGELVHAPALKRLRHFALLGGVYNDGRALLPLVDAADPARIETFAIGIPYFPERAANALRAKFGDRVRFLPA
jgi:uncharacterized protein (TIGR02996 family)